MDLADGLKQLSRMCGKYSYCVNCPLRGAGFCAVEKQDRRVNANERAAAIIEKWAEENPEQQVYPTWGEWLEQQGICFSSLTNYSYVDGITIPKVFNYQIEGKTAFMCGDKVNEPIPADIAQKLGLEPKEGT